MGKWKIDHAFGIAIFIDGFGGHPWEGNTHAKKGMNHVKVRRKSVISKGKIKCKVPDAQLGWSIQITATAYRQCGWSRGREGETGKGQGGVGPCMHLPLPCSALDEKRYNSRALAEKGLFLLHYTVKSKV